MPIVDKNPKADSYAQLQIKKPYLALNSEMYINSRQQELATCKRIDYKFYCEELFIVRHESIHSCKSAIYFDMDKEIIKQNLTLYSIIIRQTSHQQSSMVVMKLF